MLFWIIFGSLAVAVPFTNPNRIVQDSSTAPTGTALLVDAYGLKGDEVTAVSFDVPGSYFVRVTWRAADGSIPQSGLLEVTVVDVELGAPIAGIVEFSREWQPDQLADTLSVSADSHVTLTETTGSSPRSFTVKATSPMDGRIIARLPGTGAVADVVDVKAIEDYSRLFGGTQQVIDVFPDGTQMIEYLFAFGGDLPSDFRIHVTPITAGVLFEDGSLELWITPDDLDELGRYRMRLTSPADVPTSGCFSFEVFQSSQSIK